PDQTPLFCANANIVGRGETRSGAALGQGTNAGAKHGPRLVVGLRCGLEPQESTCRGGSEMSDRKPATAAEIRRIIGPAEDDLVARIVATEATAAEVLEAFTWTTSDDGLGSELDRAPRGVVATICDLLAAEQEAEQER